VCGLAADQSRLAELSCVSRDLARADGAIFLAMGARIVACGAMSQYDLADPKDAYGCKNLPLMLYPPRPDGGFFGLGRRPRG
jgi:hypothetical protein